MISRLASLTRLALIASCLAIVSACSGGASIPQCLDGVDNDGDGFIDDADPACALGDSETGDPLVACNDSVDNDGDGDIDFPADPGCERATDTDEFSEGTPECRDDIDNDGDGETDFPDDPGCLNANQDGEVDDCPDGVNCPQCGDGVDNDGDGNTDYPADTACASAAGEREFMLDPNACGVGNVITPLPANGQVAGTLTNGTSTLESVSCNGRGREIAYLVTVTEPVTMVASTDSGGTLVNTVLYLRGTCLQAASELACHDDLSLSNNHSTLTVDLQPGSYYLIVDGRDVTSVGPFQMQVNFFVGQGQECTGPTDCATGYVCRAVPPSTVTTCERPVCSDGRDDDGDLLIDFPIDPGCTNATDSDETDPCPGVGCPACGDGTDNDGDLAIDYPADTSCFSASGTSEADCPLESDALIPVVSVTTASTTAGASNSLTPTCGSSNHTAGERVHLLDLRVSVDTLTVSHNASFDAVTSFVDANCTTSLACTDFPNSITRNTVAPGRYGIVVDGFSSGTGPYVLTVRGTIAVNGFCNDPLVAAGVLTCADNTTCSGPAGMERCVPAVCNDTIDADGDGFPGFPTDPGCTALNDTDETDDCPAGPMCPQCGNDLDDDTDGFTDYPMDFGCVSASGANEECASIDPVIPFTANVVGASTVGDANDVDLTCGVDGRDDVYRLRLLAPLAELRVNTLGSALDTVLSIKRGGCASFDLQCDDNTLGNGDSAVFLVDVPAGDYFLVVDDRNVTSPGTYNLNVAGLYAPGAACDPTSTIFACTPGLVCAGATPTCIVAACNDNVDADGDGFNGFPLDPGCSSISDNDEADTCPTGPGCPVCSDDLDNDTDGRIDYPLDPGCIAASSLSEAECQIETDPLIPVTGPATPGTTLGGGFSDSLRPTCGSSSHAAPERVHFLTVRVPLATLHVDTNPTGFDNAISLMDATCGTTIQCGDSPTIDRTNVAPGGYAISVDGWGTGTGTYTLNVRGTIALGNSCVDPLVAAGVFTCVAGTICTGPSGMEACAVAACGDAVDADGDGFNGFPTDPGCSSVLDNDEADDCPTGPSCPQCSNGLDDDLDTDVDYPMDNGCTAAGGTNEECASLDPVIPFTANVVGASTATSANDFDLSCGTDGRDAVYRLVVDMPLAELRANTIGSPLDTILSIKRDECSSLDLQCDDNTAGNGDSSVFLIDPVVGNYFLIIDDKNVTSPGTYNLNVSGLYANGSMCDPTSPFFLCSPGFACVGPSGAETCVIAACNDAIDADGDTFVGYPTDPGCATLSDNDEADNCPGGAGCPQCSDDLDNDSDGSIDFGMDVGCLAASANSELECQIETDPLIPVTAPATTGTTTTVGLSNSLRPTCGSSTHAAPERVHTLTVRVPLATLHIDTNPTGFDNAISLMDANCGATIQCADSPTIDRTNVAPGGYAISVDGWGTGTGTYTLNVRGTIADGGACNDPLVAAGVFTCSAGFACTGVPGSETCTPAACNDAVDADGDGFPGFPTDPGCTSISDGDEADACPTGPGCPQCSDDLDNDTDTRIDYPLDFGCVSAAANSELECPTEVDPLLTLSTPMSTGTTVGAGANFTPSCQGSSLGDRVYILALQVPVATLVMDTEGSTLSDPVLQFMNAACGLPPIACDDDGGTGNQSLITGTNVAPGGYAILVDHYAFAGTSGPYVLNVRGTIAAGSSCNDPLVAAGVLACAVGTTCQANVCSP